MLSSYFLAVVLALFGGDPSAPGEDPGAPQASGYIFPCATCKAN
ncbi:hypothetical protein [Vulcaniibacterium tengchongense]|nr:hypothetical protein [Vulcaniibacterium tengchongense]